MMYRTPQNLHIALTSRVILCATAQNAISPYCLRNNAAWRAASQRYAMNMKQTFKLVEFDTDARRLIQRRSSPLCKRKRCYTTRLSVMRG
jgi:hypothetical protein